MDDRYGPIEPPHQAHFRSSTSQNEAGGLVVAAWVLTFLMPLIGFILGIILTAKNQTGHGVATMVVSVLWVLLLLALV
jgi:hypothetical protein